MNQNKPNKLKWAKIVVKRPRTSYKDLQVYHTHNQAGLGKPVINTKDSAWEFCRWVSLSKCL